MPPPPIHQSTLSTERCPLHPVFPLATRSKATYAIDDNWRVAGVLELYGGPDRSNFGVLKDNTRVFVELRYSH